MRKDKGIVELVKRKDTGVYLRYIYITRSIHEESMRYRTWGCIEEKMRTRLGCHAFYMRHWLRLLRRSWLLLSYPLPSSMLTPGDIDHNTRGCNFRWREESPSGCEYWLVCRHWIPEVEFNKSLSSLIIRLANYSVTTSLIYKLIV